MGEIPQAAINEGVALLFRLAPSRLETLRLDHPSLSDELKLGIKAGPSEEVDESVDLSILREKAQIMITVLAEAEAVAQMALKSVSRRVNVARRQRLVSQILVLIGSSSSLATLALGNNPAAVISAVLTLLAALGNLLAEYQEKLLNPQTGSIYDAFQRLSECVFKTRMMSTDITLALKYRQARSEMRQLVMNANSLSEELNGWLIQLIPRTSNS